MKYRETTIEHFNGYLTLTITQRWNTETSDWADEVQVRVWGENPWENWTKKVRDGKIDVRNRRIILSKLPWFEGDTKDNCML